MVGYGGAPVCGEVTAEVRAGEVLGVVGVNGAGKSTVVQTIAGRQPAISGDARIHGLLVDRDAVNFRREVAACSTTTSSFRRSASPSTCSWWPAATRWRIAEERVAAELEFFGLSDARGRRTGRLSSGQRRRLLLAAGFIRPSALLILDEPEQRLDPGMRDALAGRIAAYADGGGAVLLVTHDPRLLVRTATSALVIKDDVELVSADEGAAFIAGL